jgi:hypothetical protein
MRHALDHVRWDGDEAQAGIDVWLIATAAVEKFRVSEAALGPRAHALRMPAPDLSTILTQVVGALFAAAEMHASTWQRVRSSTLVPICGEPIRPEGEAHLVDVDAAIDAFRLGCRALRDVWAWIVEPRVILQLEKIAAGPVDRFQFDDGLWAQIIYDFALAHRERSMPRDHLLGSLAPLYLGYLAGFAREVRSAGPAGIDARIERLCLVFEALKPQLMSRWRWPERFRA